MGQSEEQHDQKLQQQSDEGQMKLIQQALQAKAQEAQARNAKRNNNSA
jgi:hypothetical protein